MMFFICFLQNYYYVLCMFVVYQTQYLVSTVETRLDTPEYAQGLKISSHACTDKQVILEIPSHYRRELDKQVTIRADEKEWCGAMMPQGSGMRGQQRQSHTDGTWNEGFFLPSQIFGPATKYGFCCGG